MPTVFVLDGDESVREALALLIRSAGWTPRTLGSAAEFLALPRALAPSCLLTELHLPDLCGFDLQRLLVERVALPIIFMCEHIDVPATVRAIKAGALEVLTKPLTFDAVISAVGDALCRSRAELDQLAHMKILGARYASLSAREREVFNLLVSGRLNKQVGFDLGISEITVKKHRGRLMRKMRAGSFAQLVTMFSHLHRWTSETRRPAFESGINDTFIHSLRLSVADVLRLQTTAIATR